MPTFRLTMSCLSDIPLFREIYKEYYERKVFYMNKEKFSRMLGKRWKVLTGINVGNQVAFWIFIIKAIKEKSPVYAILGVLSYALHLFLSFGGGLIDLEAYNDELLNSFIE